MIQVQNADGSYTSYTNAEYIAHFGEDDFRELMDDAPVPFSELTPNQQAFQRRVDDETRTNAVLADAGIDSLDDLPHESTQGTIQPTERRNRGTDRD